MTTPLTEMDQEEGTLVPPPVVNHRKNVSLDFKFIDLKKKNYFLHSANYNRELIKMSKMQNLLPRAQSGPGRYDSRLLLNKNKVSTENQLKK